MPSLMARVRSYFAGRPRGRALAARTVDDGEFFGGNASAYYRDRFEYDRYKIFAECLRAWRVNPIARNIVRTISSFVVGQGFEISAAHKRTDRFLREWAAHPQNRLAGELRRWQDERTRSGNLFFLFSVDLASGMSFVRVVPAELIAEIQCAENDVQQERFYIPKNTMDPPWPAFDAGDPVQDRFIVHFAWNRPVGVTWGEPDLAPMLPWIGRLSSMLEDRARLNRFRQAFLYTVTGRYSNAAEKAKRQAEINASPPQPGSILVTDESEKWAVIAPELNSEDAAEDILGIKKFIAAGASFPLHWLAEPESSTRTTAEAAGTPTFRGLEDLQRDFVAMLEELCRVAVRVRARVDARVRADAEIAIEAPDITERDNSSLALAVDRVYPAFADLFDRGIIDALELARMIYRMAGETIDPADVGEGERREPKGTAPRAEPDPGEEQPDAD